MTPETASSISARERALLPALRASFTAREEDGDFATDATLTRYLRARSNDVPAAGVMLKKTLEFRWARATGLGPGPSGPVMYSNFAISNRDPESSVAHMLFALEALFDSNDMQRMVWVMDFHGFRAADVSPANARNVLSLFADHYPERLGNAVIYGAPYIFYGLWRAVKLFAAPETVRKVVFVKHDKADREKKLGDIGIRGATFDRLCKEIDDARTPAGGAVNWWTKQPLDPLPHYGARITQASIA